MLHQQMRRPGSERKLGSFQELQVAHKNSSTPWNGMSQKRERRPGSRRGLTSRSLVDPLKVRTLPNQQMMSLKLGNAMTRFAF